MNTDITALVPMKKQSERIPNKNRRMFDGAPLFHKILSTLSDVPAIKKIVVDTDSEEIKEELNRNFSNVLIINRPEELQGNDVPMTEVIGHDLSQLDGEHFLQTHATNPLLTAPTISRSISLYLAGLNKGHDSLLSACVIQSRLYDKNAKPINHDLDACINSQNLEPIYEENSNIFIFSKTSFKARNHRIGTNPQIFEMSRIEGVDIDHEEDFRIAEILYKSRNTSLRK